MQISLKVQGGLSVRMRCDPQKPGNAIWLEGCSAKAYDRRHYCFSVAMYIISIYILVEIKSSFLKLVPQFARDGRETRDYYRAPHGDGYKGVYGR